MTNEAKLIVETQLAVPMTCAEDTGIAKGALLQLADLNTVSIASADAAVVGGIAKSEKIASDGMVRTDVYRGGIFRVIASGAISVGDALYLDGDGLNYVYADVNSATASGSIIIGTAMETAADEETFLMELNIQVQTDSR